MYAQQAVRSKIESVLENHPLTSGHINFSDSEVNRRLAAEGSSPSCEDGWATLDMKDASDRISWELVISLFQHCPALLRALSVLRPRSFKLPDGTLLESSKHAPMGSALCFPILATSIWAISICAQVYHGVELHDAAARTFVYGDDLIIPKAYVPTTIAFLERCGLMVNKEKSFYRGFFRESCGADFFYGTDVTPLTLRKFYILNLLFDKGQCRRRAAYAYVNHAQSIRHKLPITSEYWYALAENEIGPLPYGDETSSYLCRVVPPKDIAVYNLELLERVAKGQNRYPLYFVSPNKTKTKTSGWGHLTRVWPGIGVEDHIPIPYGVFSKPNDFKIARLTTDLRQKSR